MSKKRGDRGTFGQGCRSAPGLSVGLNRIAVKTVQNRRNLNAFSAERSTTFRSTVAEKSEQIARQLFNGFEIALASGASDSGPLAKDRFRVTTDWRSPGRIRPGLHLSSRNGGYRFTTTVFA